MKTKSCIYLVSYLSEGIESFFQTGNVVNQKKVLKKVSQTVN